MMKTTSGQGVGVALVASAAIAWSTAPLFVRLLPFDSFTILFWRGVFAGLRYVVRDPLLGPMMAAAAFMNFIAQALIAMLPVLVLRRFDADAKIV